MKSIRIGSVRGIAVLAHPSIALVLVLIVLQVGVLGILVGPLLYGSLLLHELGHAAVAQHYRLRVPRIVLHLLGGTAVMADLPKTPKQEVAIAAAGPAVSLALSVLMAFISSVLGHSALGQLFGYGSALNLILALFNLLPALPMDGGRIFRALLVPRFGLLRGTKIAGQVSRGFGVLFVLVGLFGGFWSLCLVGLFLFVMVRQEEQATELHATQLAQIPVFIPERWRHRWPDSRS